MRKPHPFAGLKPPRARARRLSRVRLRYAVFADRGRGLALDRPQVTRRAEQTRADDPGLVHRVSSFTTLRAGAADRPASELAVVRDVGGVLGLAFDLLEPALAIRSRIDRALQCIQATCTGEGDLALEDG